jgi:hypothetical protein
MPENIPRLGKIALGPVHMVLQSIHDYMHESDGEPPLRIELHPRVMHDFLADLKTNYQNHSKASVIDELFRLVPIMPCMKADMPRLIARNGRVDYL